jgi:uncharacterized protein YlxW (UPF0749 family)
MSDDDKDVRADASAPEPGPAAAARAENGSAGTAGERPEVNSVGDQTAADEPAEAAAIGDDEAAPHGAGARGDTTGGDTTGGDTAGGDEPAGATARADDSTGGDDSTDRAEPGAVDDEKTVVLDETTVVLTHPRPERFAGLLPAPGVPGRRRTHPSEPRPEIQSTDGSGADDSVRSEGDDTVHSEADTPAGRSLFGRRWAGGNRAAALIGVLLGLLGFALAVQVRSNTATNGLSGARQEDLVRILDDLTSREDRLRTQISSLEAARARLTTTGDKNTAALNEAKTRSQALGVLAGTLAAQGPGITLTMSDPHAKLRAEDILDAVEELRAAGAEAIQVGQVRIGLNSSFIDDNGVIKADGQALTTPYQILAIGEAATLATALNIPGGVVDTVRQAGGQAAITQQDRVVIRVLRSLSTPHYAQPAE